MKRPSRAPVIAWPPTGVMADRMDAERLSHYRTLHPGRHRNAGDGRLTAASRAGPGIANLLLAEGRGRHALRVSLHYEDRKRRKSPVCY